MLRFLRKLFALGAVDAEYEPYREELHRAGLRERQLRRMTPEDRVAALEKAHLDPYDYILPGLLKRPAFRKKAGRLFQGSRVQPWSPW